MHPLLKLTRYAFAATGIPRHWLGAAACLCFTLAPSPVAYAVTEGILVVAERPNDDYQTGDVDTTLSPGFSSLIRREQIDSQQSLAEVIEKEAAIQVRQSGGQGGFSTVSLRGSSNEQVSIYVDGLLLNSGASAGVDLSDIPLTDVESIEIYRGYAPLAFSRGAIGGVIHIRRLRHQQSRSNLNLGYGSFDSRDISGMANGRTGRWDYLLSAAHKQSENDFPFLYDNRTPYNLNDDRYTRRNNDQLRQQNAFARTGYRFSNATKLDLSYQWFDKTKGLPNWNNAAEARTRFDTRSQHTQLQLLADDLGRFRLNSRLRLDLNNKTEVYDDRQGLVGLGRQYFEYRTQTQAVDYYLEKVAEQHLLSLALNLQQETYRPYDRLSEQEQNSNRRQTLSLSVNDNVFLLGERLQLSPGLRASRITDRRQISVQPLIGNQQTLSRQRDYFSPQIGAKLAINHQLTLKTNLARYYRQPSFFELFGDQGFFLSNEQLQAESGINFDAGVELSHKWRQGPAKQLAASLAYFQSRVDNLITRSFDARGIGKATNIARAEIQGLESQLKLKFRSNVQLIANLTLQRPLNKTRVIGAFYDKQLPGRYTLSSLSRLDLPLGKTRLFGEFIFEGGQYYDSANLLRAKDKQEFNAGLSRRFNQTSWTLEGTNLTGNEYQDFRGYPQPGRAFYTRVKYDFNH